MRCDSGEGNWIYVEAVGYLSEEWRRVITVDERLEKVARDLAEGKQTDSHYGEEYYSPGPAIHAATKLVIGVKHGEFGSFELAVDETFRNALWEDALWQQ